MEVAMINNVECTNCKKPLHRKPSEIKRNKTGMFFCSLECDAKIRSLTKLSKSRKKIEERIGTKDFEGWLNKKYIEEEMTTQEISSLIYGTRRNDTSVCDWLRRFGIKVRKPPIQPGEKHWRYNPNKKEEERLFNRKSPDYNKWRHSVFARDNFQCQLCGEVGGELNAHHLNGFDKHPGQRLEKDNGITLCYECHNDFHNKCGRGNNTEEQFKEYALNRPNRA